MHMFSDYRMVNRGMLFLGLFWLALIAGIVFRIKSLTDKAANSSHPESAEEIMKKCRSRVANNSTKDSLPLTGFTWN